MQLKIDWSEIVKLYQTQQERSECYHTISASVNSALLYDPERTTSLGTISSVKSHKASANMASLQALLKFAGFSDTKILYIISDSPNSQYRNRKMVYLVKEWAKKSKIDAFWIYTETGDDKGPMDIIGAATKTAVKDTISYHPEAVIRKKEQLMHYLPDLNICIVKYSDEEVIQIKEIFPQPLRNLTICSRLGCGIKSAHVTQISSTNDQVIK